MSRVAGVMVMAALVVGVGNYVLPLRTVASLGIRLEEQDGEPYIGRASAAFYDPDGQLITEIRQGTFGIRWWASSELPEKSTMTPEDAMRARWVTIAAGGCQEVSLPVTPSKSYRGPGGCHPHGGGPAFVLYTFEETVRLNCLPRTP